MTISIPISSFFVILFLFLKFFAYLSFGDEPVSPSLQKIILPRDRIVIVNICSTFEIDRRGIFALINDSEIFQVPKIPHKFDAETITIPGDILFDEFKLEIQSHAVNIKANLKARQIWSLPLEESSSPASWRYEQFW